MFSTFSLHQILQAMYYVNQLQITPDSALRMIWFVNIGSKTGLSDNIVRNITEKVKFMVHDFESG
ncbi:uncharacterized membrane protein YfbV (UPF0208 family) [Pantoea agglomerans]|jgi:uncharacterized membrane protein YfbV (UPF0208 family)|nr:uncharacterized membrane protein YfbV (UPF0208 family) [Pantoea agglomerans]